MGRVGEPFKILKLCFDMVRVFGYPNVMRVDGPSTTELHPNRREELGRLAERLREVERRSAPACAPVRLPWAEGESAGAGCVGEVGVGAVHEWVGLLEEAAHPLVAPPPSPSPSPLPSLPSVRPRAGGPGAWVPPVTILAHVAAAAARSLGGGEVGEAAGVVVWIGARVWPTWAVWREAAAAAGVSPHRHVLVDPPDEEARAWAIDLALRRPGTVVAADASGLERRTRASSSRRFQLAAESSGSIALLAHPPDAEARVSFAATRWTVTAAVSPTGGARWEVGLVRRKGLRAMDSPRWTVERAPGGLVLADSLLAGVPAARDGRGPSRAAS